MNVQRACSRHYVAGIDGGGTGTRAVVATLDGQIIAEGTSGPANLQSEGEQRTLQALAAALDAALAATEGQRIVREDLVALAVGLAGAHLAADRTRIARGLQAELPRTRITIWTDAEASMAAALGDEPGILVIAGTGSIAMGRDAAGRIARSGGWGYLIGDEGSAHAIARAGLQAASRAVDGRSGPSLLADAFARALTVEDFDHLLGQLYGPPPLTRAQIAHLAPVVGTCAAAGDAAATTVLETAAEQLAEMALAVARRLGMAENPVPVLCSGGVWRAGDVIRGPFTHALSEMLPLARTGRPLLSPAAGAALLALQSLGDGVPASTRYRNLRHIPA